MSSLAGLSGASKVGLALQGVSAVGGILGAQDAARQQKAALAFEAGQQRLQDAQQNLDLSQRELAAQKRLRKTLAAMTVRANAFGADLSSGSAANLLESAHFDAAGEMDLYGTKRRLLADGARSAEQIYAYKRRAINDSRDGAVLGTLLDFGISAADTVARNDKIGTAAHDKNIGTMTRREQTSLLARYGQMGRA